VGAGGIRGRGRGREKLGELGDEIGVASKEDSDLGTCDVNGAVFHLKLVKCFEEIFVDVRVFGKTLLDFGDKIVTAATQHQQTNPAIMV
jgi:hypothetical protein